MFISLFERQDNEREDEEDENNQFVPSPLDLSIRFAHGGPDNEVERELNKINEQARELEEKQSEK